ncbi:related to Alpha/beta-glucosidase agdC [Ramularia collo-cygni]|uniref:Related to Alpha/beta-glucosidase agdC n=1 Tax=Ramularia collo-cygni TaxID=112498 RepID=A0A2D3UZU0_9PEZI|nr:related to Alpha/beta-glucosidase agdC [Ramularia collo-cygni]CZT23567.1 related to Alpha/beta-glucosidase agdC [Ramularia collo-cygni]
MLDEISKWLPGSTQQQVMSAPITCPGYLTSNITHTTTGIIASLHLAGPECNSYGKDLHNLTLEVQCQSENRMHIHIYDPELQIYQIPESVLPRPGGSTPCAESDLDITVVDSPFSFAVSRKSNQDVLFNTSNTPLIFQDQYWQLTTSLPHDPNLYGLGEHTDPLRLNTTDYLRTFWNRDANDVPEGSNLYGSHPVYFENRIIDGVANSHGVALLNSNGMDIRIDRSDSHDQYLEYNILGGIIDLYIFSGPSPFDVAKQYTALSGTPPIMPFFGLGSHQCRHGYKNVEELGAVVSNYSKAGIPLETMWADIVDPINFPLAKMRRLVDKLHRDQQHFIVMVDPAVAYQDYPSFNRGKEAGIFLQNSSNQIYQGVVWPGVTAYPDWFSQNIQEYWSSEFASFFDPESGLDIDALWIDMNEPANFCRYPCINPKMEALNWNNNTMPLPQSPKLERHSSFSGDRLGLPGRDLDNPPYKIHISEGIISDRTANTTLRHENGMAMYDTHNIYGHMMSIASHTAMLARRPLKRAMVITRSTFIGTGSQVAHWLGDNVSTWHHYRQSIRHLLQFTSIFQIPMAGADICGFGGSTTEELCARWYRLGAWYPFMRNHYTKNSIPQEPYRWPIVAESARKAIDLRYRLLDYLYSHLQLQSVDGTPALVPLWMHYPCDAKAAAIDDQFFFGPALLISPVLEQGSTSVKIYLPEDLFYDFETHKPIFGKAEWITLQDVGVTEIPVHIRGGHIIPMRVSSANTTTELRKGNFELLIAPDMDGRAEGYLYLDDGESLEQDGTSEIHFTYANGKLGMVGTFDYIPGRELMVEKAIILGIEESQEEMLGWPLVKASGVELQTR